MTVGELRVGLANTEADLEVVLFVNGTLTKLTDVRVFPGLHFAIVRGEDNLARGKQFSINEQGLIPVLAANGVSDQQIGELLNRPAKSIKMKRIALGS